MVSGLILCFSNHSNIWLDRRKLDIHICAFCIECNFVKLHCILLRELEYKGQIMTYYYENSLYFMDPLKMSQGPQVAPKPLFENCCSRGTSLSHAGFHTQWHSAISHSFSWKPSHLLIWMFQGFSQSIRISRAGIWELSKILLFAYILWSWSDPKREPSSWHPHSSKLEAIALSTGC